MSNVLVEAKKAKRERERNNDICFHAKMWNRAHKTKFEVLERINFVGKVTILDHNFGYRKASLLKYLKLESSALRDPSN